MEGNARKILLVEDDMFISDIYQTKLKGDGFDVTSVENGLEALKKLEGGLMPDLILLDIMMPYMDGLEFLKHLRAKEEWKTVPVMLLTNLFQKEQVDEGLSLGASDYLIKSHFTPSEVVEKINALLQK
jgi:DNA-binding response OmpR family regulator